MVATSCCRIVLQGTMYVRRLCRSTSSAVKVSRIDVVTRPTFRKSPSIHDSRGHAILGGSEQPDWPPPEYLPTTRRYLVYNPNYPRPLIVDRLDICESVSRSLCIADRSYCIWKNSSTRDRTVCQAPSKLALLCRRHRAIDTGSPRSNISDNR